MTEKDDKYNSMEEYYESEIKVENKEESKTPLEILSETKILEEPLDNLLLTIYKEDEITLNELSESVEVHRSKLNRFLGELRLEGYLGVEYKDGQKYYYVRSHWETEEFPSGPVIPLVYQYNLLSDRQRLSTIKKAINKTVSEGDIVADLGAGVGVLSYLASSKADTVYAVEMDREVYEKGREIMANENVDNVEYIRDDARNVELPQNVDVIICEMLDTALAAELQVPVMNNALSGVGKEEVDTIPSAAKTTAQLIRSDYEFYDGEFKLPHFEEYGSRESKVVSKEKLYHKADFTEKNSELVEKKISLSPNTTGTVNGIQLNTYTQFCPEIEFVGASPWLNAPLNLPFDDNFDLGLDETVEIQLSYQLGGGLNNITYEVTNIETDE